MVSKANLQKQIDELKKDLDVVKNVDFRLEVAVLKTHMNSLRGLINRRIGKNLDELDNKEQKERNKSPDGLDELR